jgi:poly [ADP-ribose] polymerase
MAPKKKMVAATLEGCTIAISGTFADSNHATIQGTITSLGASVGKTVNADTNMLISTPSDVAKTSTKVKGALKHQVPIVSLDWLDECASSLIKQDVDDYLLNAPANAAAPAAVSKGKKRAISPDAFSPPAPAPDHKKAKIEPKFGEGSLVKSRDVVIPLDEYCPLGAYRVYVDEDGVIYDAALNQTNASNNNNKFYRIQVCNSDTSKDASFKKVFYPVVS